MATLAQQVLQYAEQLDDPEGPEHDLDDELEEVIIPGALWAAWISRAKVEYPTPEESIARLGTAMGAVRAQGFAPPSPRAYDLGVIACSAAKALTIDSSASRSLPARDLYTGDLFKLSLAAAERLCRRVVILSALHGVVTLDQQLGWYDRKLPTAKREREQWQSRVSMTLQHLVRVATLQHPVTMTRVPRIADVRVLILAPQSYASGLYLGTYPRPSAERPHVDEPLKGLGIGKQKAALKTMLLGAAA